MPVLLLAYAPGDSLLLLLEFFAWLFLGLCRCCLLAGVWLAYCLCTDFFTGIFHEKKRRKTPALFWLSFSGAVVFTDAASWPQAVRLLNDCRAAKIPAFAVFAKNRPEILCKNNSPVPPKGGRGERFSRD